MTGRPRDPQLDGRILRTATTVLGTQRLSGFTVDEVAATAGCGKAAIYRRWPNLHSLLVDVVADLGVRVEYSEGPGTAEQDLVRLLLAAITGDRARAEAAVLPAIGLDDWLRVAYFTGPAHRFTEAAGVAAERALARGESWPSLEPIRAAHALLMQRIQVGGWQPPTGLVALVVESIVIPALNIYPTRTVTA